MSDTLLLLGAFGAAYLGFALLALSQARHWTSAVGTAALCGVQILVLRFGGGVMIVLSHVLAVLRDGPSFGSLLWATAISLAALAVAFTLAWRPVVLRPLARGVAPLARLRLARRARCVDSQSR